MRVQIFGINYAPELTGIAPYTTRLAESLSTEHDVTVLTGLPHYPAWQVERGYRHWRREEVDGRLRVVRLGHYVPRSPTVARRIAYETSWSAHAAAVGTRIPADVVIAVVPALFGALAARLVARHHSAPLGIFMQDLMSTAAVQSGTAGRFSARAAGMVERATIGKADSVTTIHPRLAAEISRVLKLKSEPNVIYNWTHVKGQPHTDRRMRQKLGWRDDQIVVLHSGNMGLKQNLEVVVDAAKLAEANGDCVQFVLAGGGSQHAVLSERGKGCRNLQFVDNVDNADYLDLLDAADVLLVNERPGVSEMSLPSKMTSYLVVGRPIVAATDEHSATADFVRACGGGVITEPGNPAGLLEAVRRLVKDTDLCAELGIRGRAFAEASLAEDAALAAYSRWVADLRDGRAVASLGT